MAPAKPLQLVWSAINRITAEGNVVGPEQRVDLETALRAITIDAAFSIRLENEVGSITPGKYANFTVLEQSPYDVKPENLKEIKVWGTVLEGRIQPVPADAIEKSSNEAPIQPSFAGLAQERPGVARNVALTSSAYRLAASRQANDLGLCQEHAPMVQAFASSMFE
jgi:hypothetical protein